MHSNNNSDGSVPMGEWGAFYRDYERREDGILFRRFFEVEAEVDKTVANLETLGIACHKTSATYGTTMTYNAEVLDIDAFMAAFPEAVVDGYNDPSKEDLAHRTIKQEVDQARLEWEKLYGLRRPNHRSEDEIRFDRIRQARSDEVLLDESAWQYQAAANVYMLTLPDYAGLALAEGVAWRTHGSTGDHNCISLFANGQIIYRVMAAPGKLKEAREEVARRKEMVEFLGGEDWQASGNGEYRLAMPSRIVELAVRWINNAFSPKEDRLHVEGFGQQENPILVLDKESFAIVQSALQELRNAEWLAQKLAEIEAPRGANFPGSTIKKG